MYIELHAASAFSFLQGASLPEALIERAAALGYPALALLDADGVYGAPRFHKAAKSAGLRAIIGAELTIGTRDSGLGTRERGTRNLRIPNPESRIPITWRLPVLVSSPEGYQNLCRLVTRMKMRASPPGSPPRTPARWGGKGEGALALEELDGLTAGLVALAGRPALDARQHGVGGMLDRIVGLFGRGNVCVELQRHLLRDEESDNTALTELARAFRVPVIATNGTRFATPADRPLFDVLTCVYHHTTLDEAGRRLSRNAERYLKSPEVMAALFSDRPDALAGTAALAERLEYTMADLGYKFPAYPVPPGETETSFLRHITEAGARDRYRPYHDKARVQITRELDLIEKLDLAGYFLIVWDIVNYCRQQDILVQGRGSAANSAVCYSLGITAVDPIKMELLFERFLSEERGEWPDIDLDLPSGDRRERVIQHVYEKYGRLGAAMTANVITYRGRSAAREVGKVLSLNDEQIDRLAKVMHHFEFRDPNETLTRNMDVTGLSLESPRMQTFAEMWRSIQDLPRHLGQHSGGMVVCQGALDSVVPLEPASMPGRVVIQWDKDDCADMGIVKVDLLGLGMMAVLQDAIELVNTAGTGGSGSGTRDSGLGTREPGIPSDPGSRIPDPESRVPRFDLAHIPQDDPAVYDLLQKADTIGVFQVESRAQMATLPRLKPTCFYDLVVEVAIIRPGPIVGDMVHPYLNRRAGREPVIPLHPCLEPVLARTLGVPLFQEQLLRMAMVAAGFTGGQAEELRRAMGFKRSEKRMKQVGVQLREGMASNGITGATAERIINSITSFALYGFPESHAASFALLAYASAYLKVHYPAAFYTALLNNQPMGFYHPATLVKDAQRRGVRFHPIDVQQSDWLCRVETDGAIRLGLMYVNGLRKEAGQTMAAFDKGRLKPAPTTDSNVGAGFSRPECTKCGADDDSMIEVVTDGTREPGSGIRDSGFGNIQRSRVPSPESRVPSRTYYCNICSHEWTVDLQPAGRFQSIEDVVQRTGLRRDELTTLADIGALNAFTNERRSALWQVERAVRPAGELFRDSGLGIRDPGSGIQDSGGSRSWLSSPESRAPGPESRVPSPLAPMDTSERLQADYAGMGLTIGPHPMALRRGELALRGVLRASDLPRARDGRRVRVAGMVITRQRPGTAKGFVFLTLEDETGISNVIIRPDLFDRERLIVIRHPFLIVDGVLQHQDGVLSIRAERVEGIQGDAAIDAHDFY
ncbi:MAG TPA: error-prone DNA polymerase [Vicinamibacterales bacterium]|nr:error-prone DNA polymerase [Vicinamibacterales bacterium]